MTNENREKIGQVGNLPAQLRPRGRGRPPSARARIWEVLGVRLRDNDRIEVSMRELAAAANISVTAAWQALRLFEKQQLISLQLAPSRRGGKTTITKVERPTIPAAPTVPSVENTMQT